METLISVLCGAIAGWLASKIMHSKSGGILLNIILGILGGYVGNWVFDLLNVSVENSWLGRIITATIGAILLIAGTRMLFKKK
ncbi:MAG: GlsB/YeaQ/YmgE family stress response membrane protein [Crocinitomicaceae bacterium]|nr:GlsB/YeaQ/YmgE family stress response membrane protein [Crocinitomicaceae bacterium]